MISEFLFICDSFVKIKQIDEIDVSFDLITVFEIIVISLLLASFAGAVSISQITKYEPIKISVPVKTPDKARNAATIKS